MLSLLSFRQLDPLLFTVVSRCQSPGIVSWLASLSLLRVMLDLRSMSSARGKRHGRSCCSENPPVSISNITTTRAIHTSVFEY